MNLVDPGIRARVTRPAILSTTRGVVGLVLLLVIVCVAVLGPLLAPYPIDQPNGIPGSAPGGAAMLGTDQLGRDVLSRFLNGGWPLLSTTVMAVLITYAVGVTVGMYAGLASRRVDEGIMRATEIFLIFPPLLVLLVLAAGAGTSMVILMLGVVIVMTPGVIRVVRTMTLEVGATSYVEAAIARGERTSAILRREVLPNIVPGLIADAGVRFLGAIFLIGSMSFLGLGSQPPTANWALMISENRSIISTNLWSVLAPAAALALLTVSVNLVGDAYVSARTSTRGNR